jgi:hypothetical protein
MSATGRPGSGRGRRSPLGLPHTTSFGSDLDLSIRQEPDELIGQVGDLGIGQVYSFAGRQSSKRNGEAAQDSKTSEFAVDSEV